MLEGVQKNKPWKEDYQTGSPLKFAVVIISGKSGDGIGGVSVGPFESREETIEFMEWFEKNYPQFSGRAMIGSIQLMGQEEFKAVLADEKHKKELKEAGGLHS